MRPLPTAPAQVHADAALCALVLERQQVCFHRSRRSLPSAECAGPRHTRACAIGSEPVRGRAGVRPAPSHERTARTAWARFCPQARRDLRCCCDRHLARLTNRTAPKLNMRCAPTWPCKSRAGHQKSHDRLRKAFEGWHCAERTPLRTATPAQEHTAVSLVIRKITGWSSAWRGRMPDPRLLAGTVVAGTSLHTASHEPQFSMRRALWTLAIIDQLFY